MSVQEFLMPEGRTLVDAAKAINKRLREHPSTRGDMDLGCSWDLEGKAIWPERYRWLACYAVTGSEGHWVHVDALISDPATGAWTRMPLFQGKTFEGLDYAYRVACACAKMLGA